MKKILKFGGSSVADGSCIQRVTRIIQQNIGADHEVFIVVSALSGITDQLLGLAKSLQDNQGVDLKLKQILDHHQHVIQELALDTPSELQNKIEVISAQLKQTLTQFTKDPARFLQWQDELLSYGERFSANILTANLENTGIVAECLDARQVIITDANFGDAYVHYQRSYDRIRAYLKGHSKLQVITGFMGATEAGTTTTLGRSGSDYSASIFGAALNVGEIEIWTDVDGIMTANPRLVDEATTIDRLTYEEAMELSHAGARVIFPPTMIPALYKPIPIVI
ncbi:MAG: aspartate kinase, partial [Candidatus Marinimicrobia bacterium]|nr:aspartate kinase [Candidatus Neomarinimicrobiota bacterium]